MRRREFLTTVAAASLLPQVSGRASATAAAAAPEQLKLGVASYSLRKFPFDKALEMAKACDVRYINFKDVHLPRTDTPDAIKAARAKTEAAGFTIMGGGTITWVQKGPAWQPSDAEQVRKDFEYAKLAGMPLIVAAPSFEALDTVEKTAKEFDIKVAIHNHGPEDKFFPPRPRLRFSRQGLERPEEPRQPGHRRQGRDRFPCALPGTRQNRLHRTRRPRVRDRRRQSVAGDAAVVRLHARRAGRHPADVTERLARTRGDS